jgi:calcium permeable stress-gated cation channel
VVFIFLVASTYWQLVRDLANFPAKIPEKLAKALQTGRARNFFLSYVILQGKVSIPHNLCILMTTIGMGIMPLQILNLGIIIPRALMRMFVTRTPRGEVEHIGHEVHVLIHV